MTAPATKTRPAKKAAVRKHRTRKTTPPTPTPLVLDLPAVDFAHAWGWVRTAASTDESRPVLCGLNLEVYGPSSVRLVATNSYCLLHCWVSADDDPGVTDEPLSTALVADEAGRLTALMKFVARTAGPFDRIRLEVTDNTAVFATDTETVKVERIVTKGGELADFPTWRSLLGQVAGADAPGEQLAMSPKMLTWLASIKPPRHHTRGLMAPVRMVPSVKPLGPIGLAWPSFRPQLFGLVMPVRES